MNKLSLTLGLTLCLSLFNTVSAQECSDGLHRPLRLTFSKAKVNSFGDARWSSTKPRYGHMLSSSKRVRGKNKYAVKSGAVDFPLERAAILCLTGIGVGYLGQGDQQWVGVPAVLVAVAMPFPGQSRNGQFSASSRRKSKLLGLFAYVVAYGVGLGVGEQLILKPTVQ
tara:strand:- start:11992 stop:12495 length:504 start_codon:yes stop_codon:yes gene_type:complete